jgi:hypothetical protein
LAAFQQAGMHSVAQRLKWRARDGQMVETRRARRFRAAKPACIEQSGDKLPCTIRDMSLTGASLEVSQAGPVPETFNLILPEDGLSLHCHVVWRRGFRLGVKFDEP